ncbi:MAG: NUDIX hydrolase [bacterium]|nr:NUDIX hydrolase [bacterium]
MEQPNVRIMVVIIRENKLLLLKSKDSRNSDWLLPGGSVKCGKSIVESAQEDVWEETNLQIRIKRILMINESISPDKHRHVINIYFLGEILGGELKVGRSSILQDCKFLGLEEIEKIEIHPNIKKEIKEMIADGIYVEAKHQGNMWTDR